MSSENGRFYVIDHKTGRKFCIEPIGDSHIKWGDINPATKKVEGNYGEKYPGSIHIDDSIITKENGYKNIIVGEIGQSPTDIINSILNS
jgi:hypothetical protein